MSRRERFSFDDDTIEIKKEDLNQASKSKQKKPSVNLHEDGLGSSSNKKIKKKSKIKMKKWQIALIAFLSMAIVFVVYVFVAGANDGPVYGDRCASLISIDKTKFDSVEEKIKADPSINSVEIEVDCRIIKITMNFIDNTTSDNAKQLATKALHTLDDALGEAKESGSAYSKLLGSANGRGQYNVEFILTSNGDSNFPIFGTKHPSSDDIAFTGANVVDQATTDLVTKKTQGQ